MLHRMYCPKCAWIPYQGDVDENSEVYCEYCENQRLIYIKPAKGDGSVWRQEQRKLIIQNPVYSKEAEDYRDQRQSEQQREMFRSGGAGKCPKCGSSNLAATSTAAVFLFGIKVNNTKRQCLNCGKVFK